MKIECGVRVLAVILIAASITSCVAPDMRHQIVISARDQKLALLDRGNVMAIYPVSTSKFGLGDWQRSSYTPLGKLEIAKKIGDNAPPGAVLDDRRQAARRRSSPAALCPYSGEFDPGESINGAWAYRPRAKFTFPMASSLIAQARRAVPRSTRQCVCGLARRGRTSAPGQLPVD